MTTAPKAKPIRKPVLMRWQRLVDPRTGEEVPALVPANGIHRRMLKARKYRFGDEVRAELKKPRNPKFLRLVHGLGSLMVEQVDGFQNGDAHDAIKRLQREAGVCCEAQELDLGPLGKVVANVARSMSFDQMSEEEFSLLWQGICDHVTAAYMQGMSREALEEAVLMMEGQR